MKINQHDIPEFFGTKLNDQIVFMETLSKIIKTPITLSILDSLKELRGIKQEKIPK